MKQLLTVLALLCVFTTSAQLQLKPTYKKEVIGTVKNMGTLFAELSYQVDEDKDTLYILMFKNVKYKTLVEYEYVPFSGEGDTFNQFYGILKAAFSPEHKHKDYKVRFTLGETDMTVTGESVMGVAGVYLFTDNGYVSFTERQVDKLFRK